MFNIFRRCPHNIIGGKYFNRCSLCKIYENKQSEKNFNDILDNENKKRKEVELKKIIEFHEITKKRKIEEEKRFKLNEQKKIDKIKETYNQNRNVIKNILKTNEKSKLNYLLKLNPYEFEKVVANMFELDGYKTKVTSKSNDGGKDIIMHKNNKLYLVECKRYNRDNKIGREALQKFFAAIYEEKAEGGFFITTSDYTSTAYDYPKAINNKIKLINGEKLSKAMLRVFPINDKFLNNYSEVCLECGELVNFNYPKIKFTKCTNGHNVNSTIDDIIKEIYKK